MHKSRYSTAVLTSRGSPLCTAAADRFFGLPAVVATTGVSRSSIYAWIKRGEFPKPRKLGPRRVAWARSDIEAWMNSRQLAA